MRFPLLVAVLLVACNCTADNPCFAPADQAAPIDQAELGAIDQAQPIDQAELGAIDQAQPIDQAELGAIDQAQPIDQATADIMASGTPVCVSRNLGSCGQGGMLKGDGGQTFCVCSDGKTICSIHSDGGCQ